MRWPWPPAARKFSVRLVVRRAEGLQPPAPPAADADVEAKVAVEVTWKGPKARWKGIRVYRNRTRLESASAADAASSSSSDVVEWEEEFEDVVTLTETSHRRKTSAAAFHPWDISFSVLNDSNKGPKSESILGTASLNLADYTSAAEEDVEIILPLSVPNGTPESPPSLHLTLGLVELRLPQQLPDASQRSVVTAPLSPSSGDSVPSGKDELSVIKAGLRKVKHITDLVSIRRSKKAKRDDDNSDKYVHSDGAEYPCTIDSDDDLDDTQRDQDLGSSTVRKSFSYGSLQSVNYAVLHAKIRPLTVAPNKSFVGFFQPESVEDASGFDFLDGAMSFDNIWEEISRAAECSSERPTLYVVSWNDHFFVLKVEADAYYIIDTLGERLYEGCDQAYILKFDDKTTIHKAAAEKKEANSDSSTTHHKDSSESSSTEQDSGTDTEESELVLKGKEACKEYIKSFLAAIPIRELQADIKKGLMASTPLHHRLQIEFHYTESCPREIALPSQFPMIEAPFEFSWPDPPPAMEIALTPAVAVSLFFRANPEANQVEDLASPS
uniref:Uncharacterized protein n=1 Tax=Avena sativa TaxID=4498 RepID=A0ACD5X3Q1_AVESA